MIKNKTTGIKMIGGEGNRFENNTFQNIDTSFDIKGGKDNLFSKNKIIKSKKRIIVDWILSIVGIIVAGLILYYIFGIK